MTVRLLPALAKALQWVSATAGGAATAVELESWRHEDHAATLPSLPMPKNPHVVYGHDRTIHRTGELNVETYKGSVVAVWFRCRMLPFDQTDVDAERAMSMAKSSDDLDHNIVGIEFEVTGPRFINGG